MFIFVMIKQSLRLTGNSFWMKSSLICPNEYLKYNSNYVLPQIVILQGASHNLQSSIFGTPTTHEQLPVGRLWPRGISNLRMHRNYPTGLLKHRLWAHSQTLYSLGLGWGWKVWILTRSWMMLNLLVWNHPLRNNVWAFSRGQQMFSAVGQIINILGFISHMVSVITTQLCPFTLKAATDHM